MRVAVTGAGGFVGHAVTRALQDAGHDVLALTRRSPVDVPGVAVRYGELDGGLGAVLADVDAVCHLAAAVQVRASRADPVGTWRANLDGTLAVLDALVRAGRGARLVLASTAAVYGEVGPDPVREDHPTAPIHPYGASKLAADLAARDLAATGAIGACTPGTWRAFHLGSGRPVSVRDVIDTAARVTDRAVPVSHRPAAAEPSSLVADASRAHAELGWTPRRSSIERIVSDAWAARSP